MAWQGGYVSDVPYASGVYPEAGPAHLSACALLGGVRPPDPSAPFRYLELGCGSAMGLTAFAAANPHASFTGVDFNPAHVVVAARLIAEAGLENAEVREASFADFAPAPLEPSARYDYVSVRGVWTWVGRQAQLDLVRLLDHVVAPGGLVCVGYNSMVRWASSLTMQRLIMAHAARVPGDSVAKVRAAIAFVIALDAKAPGSLDVTNLRMAIDRFGGDPVRLPTPVLSYLAHEYLNTSWRPVFPDELETDLAPAKLVHVASADPVANMAELMLSDAQVEAAAVYEDPQGRRRLGDLLAGQGFRSDIFARGAPALPPDRQAQLLEAVELMAVRPRDAAPMEIPTGSTRLSLDAAVWSPLYDRLAAGPARVGELVRIAGEAGHAVSPQEAAMVLLAGGAASATTRPGVPLDDAARERARRFNVAMMEALRELSGLRLALASVRLGGAASMNLEECLAYLTLAAPGLNAPVLADPALRELARECEPLWRAIGVL